MTDLRAARKKHEKNVAEIYGLTGLTGRAYYTRILEIAAQDTLGLENSVERNRVLMEICEVALALREG